MFPIKNIRKYVTDKLDEITVLRRFRNISGILTVEETEKNTDKKKELLHKVEVRSIPIDDNVWIFENEFIHQSNINYEAIEDQKGAFTSAGKKVEKTIIYHKSNRLYLFMIEMKSTISPVKMQEEVIKKFENSLSTLSVFISAHFEFPQFEDSQIYPVGICCYNYYDDSDPYRHRDPRKAAGCIREKYSKGDRIILMTLEPIGLNRMKSPVFFYENTNRNPVTNSFIIELDTIIKDIEQKNFN